MQDCAAFAPARGEPARIVRRERLEAEAQAEHILARARSEAEDQRRAAQAAQAEARAQAVEEGYREGLARAAAEVSASLAHEQRQNQSHADRLVQLATLLAERILGRALELDGLALRDMATVLLAEVRGAQRITFRCRPGDVTELQDALAGFRAHADIRVEGSAELGPGDFELITDVGTLKGAIGSRLELLARKLSVGLDP
jgi:flagellar biosynthesis/type III secretory pathway protein FliH